MKARYWGYSALALLVLAAAVTLSWFHVDGSELSSVENLSESYIACVEKSQNMGLHARDSATYTLNRKQILDLKELLLDSSFIRRTSDSYTYNGIRDTYSIFLELYAMDRQRDCFQITIVEDLYLSIHNPYTKERLTLRILDSQLDEKLAQILSGN